MTLIPTSVPNTLITTLAVTVAVGTTVHAAGLPRNSVGSAQLKNGAVVTQKLGPGAVTGGKIAPRSVGRSHLASSATTFVDSGIGQPQDPVEVAPVLISERAVRLPRAGRVLVEVTNPSMGINCGSGSTAMAGLYWDGEPVPGSAVVVSLTSDRRSLRIPAVVTTDGGAHTAELRAWCTNASGAGGQAVSINTAWSFVMP